MSVAESARKRRQVDQLVKSDLHKALEVAESIPESWYKAQALASVAEQEKDKKVQLKLINKSFSAASECEEACLIASVSSWPLGVLVKCGFTEEVHMHTQRLIDILKTEIHPVRRGWAMAGVLGVLMNGTKDDFLKVFWYYMETCTEAYSWRLDMTCRRLAPSIDRYDQNLTAPLLNCIRNLKVRRRAERDIAEARRLA